MKKIILICLVMTFLVVAPLWAAEEQPPQTRQTSSPGYEDMNRGMMGSGSGYYGRGPGMMRYGDHMGRRMGPDRHGWQSMTPEQQEQWRRMRADFLRDSLPLRQELNAKQMELEMLWDQQNPDPEKVKALSGRITELRSELEKKHDAYLTQCRQEFGDHGWACPGGGWGNY